MTVEKNFCFCFKLLKQTYQQNKIFVTKHICKEENNLENLVENYVINEAKSKVVNNE